MADEAAGLACRLHRSLLNGREGLVARVDGGAELAIRPLWRSTPWPAVTMPRAAIAVWTGAQIGAKVRWMPEGSSSGRRNGA